MLGIWLPELDRKIRIRNKGHEVCLLVTNLKEETIEVLSVTDPESIKRFDVYKGYLLNLNNATEKNSQQKYDEIIDNFKLTFNL